MKAAIVVITAVVALYGCGGKWMTAQEFDSLNTTTATSTMLGEENFGKTICIPKSLTAADIDNKIGLNSIDSLVQLFVDIASLQVDKPYASFISKSYKTTFPCPKGSL